MFWLFNATICDATRTTNAEEIACNNNNNNDNNSIYNNNNNSNMNISATPENKRIAITFSSKSSVNKC